MIRFQMKAERTTDLAAPVESVFCLGQKFLGWVEQSLTTRRPRSVSMAIGSGKVC